jgi:hypothetical protein
LIEGRIEQRCFLSLFCCYFSLLNFHKVFLAFLLVSWDLGKFKVSINMTRFFCNLFSFFSNSFLKRCYNIVGEIMDLLALINAAIGFVLYGSMSKQFRVTFKSLFLRRRPPKLESTRVTNINHTTTNVWLRVLNYIGMKRWIYCCRN